MDDAGAQLAADAAQVVDVVEQGVDQRAVGVARGRVDDHARRLVDDDDVGVLVDDVERQGLRLRRGRRRGRHVDDHFLLRLDREAGRPSRATPSIWTLPSLISRWICDRDCCGRSAASSVEAGAGCSGMATSSVTRLHRSWRRPRSGSRRRAAATATSSITEAERHQHDRDELRQREVSPNTTRPRSPRKNSMTNREIA